MSEYHGELHHARAGDNRPLFTIGNQTVTVDEWHAAVLGLVGLFIGERNNAFQTILAEPPYFAGVFVLSYLLGRRLRD